MIYVGIVGAGKGGTSLLKTLATVPGVKLVGIADLDSGAPGMVLARKYDVLTTNDFTELLEFSQKKIIIEATGIDQVVNKLKKLADEKTYIIDSSAALLMMLMVESREKLIIELEEQSGKMAALAQELVGTMHQISSGSESNVTQLSDSVSALSNVTNKNERHLNETQEIISFTKHVAAQTKLLGLNASIEAARAGTEGLGFGVVAQEIRKLADDSEHSTQRINEIVNLIRSATEETVSFVQNIEQSTESFVKYQKEYSSLLKSVVEQIENLANNLSILSSM